MRRSVAVVLIVAALAIGAVGGALLYRATSLRPCLAAVPNPTPRDPVDALLATPSSHDVQGVRIAGECVPKR